MYYFIKETETIASPRIFYHRFYIKLDSAVVNNKISIISKSSASKVLSNDHHRIHFPKHKYFPKKFKLLKSSVQTTKKGQKMAFSLLLKGRFSKFSASFNST